MLEQELKLHIPPAARAAVLKQLTALAGPRRVRLRAMYFDTPDRRLAKQEAALRLRLEGRRWVQTFKMAGADTLTRLEFNHPRPGPELDLSLFAGTPASRVLESVGPGLAVRYETDVMRLTRQVRTRTGVVELACDVGVVRAGELELPVCELEFELVKGKPSALFTLAQRWIKAHGLRLDLRSKAERGDALANVMEWLARKNTPEPVAAALSRYAAPRRQADVSFDPKGTPEQALRAITSECLDQLKRNNLLVHRVDGISLTDEEEAEAVHQWRVGMRRLRSAWKWFEGIAVLPPLEWREQARSLFGALGAQRDDHVLQAEIMPRLVEAGMPPLAPSSTSADAVSAAALLDGGGYEDWALRLYQWAVAPPEAATPVAIVQADDAEALAPQPAGQAGFATLLRKLRKWHRRMVKQGRRFDILADEERHDLRKLGKRLRYNLAFASPLLSARRTKPYRNQLAVVQEVLGEFNDQITARDVLLQRAAAEPHAWFGVGWLAAQLTVCHAEARNQFIKLEQVRPFWSGRL